VKTRRTSSDLKRSLGKEERRRNQHSPKSLWEKIRGEDTATLTKRGEPGESPKGVKRRKRKGGKEINPLGLKQSDRSRRESLEPRNSGEVAPAPGSRKHWCSVRIKRDGYRKESPNHSKKNPSRNWEEQKAEREKRGPKLLSPGRGR